MDISIKDDVKQVMKQLTRIQRKQIPFATSQAINDVAFMARKNLITSAKLKLDTPTPATLKGFLIEKARKSHLIGKVYITPHVAKYLKWQITGGTQSTSVHGASMIAVPVNAKLNKYGNIPNRKKGIVKTNKQFIGTYKGTYGVWQSSKKGGEGTIQLIAAFHDKVVHKKTFPFSKIINVTVDRKFKRQLNKRLRVALAHAR